MSISAARAPEPEAPLEIRLDLHKDEHERIASALQAQQKRRARYETILVLTCLLAVIYTYPVANFDENPLIEIDVISLKMPLRDAIAVFPTIIATIYLIFLGTAVPQVSMIFALLCNEVTCAHFKSTGRLLSIDKLRNNESPLLTVYLLVPSPLHPHGLGYSEFAAISRTIVNWFVGLIFNLLPYASFGLIAYYSWSLLKSCLLLGWDIICMGVMILSFLSAIMSARSQRF